jgi:hypothetical protein
MHGSMWRELETEQGTCPWSLGWDNHPGNRGRHEGPRTSRQEKQPRQFPTLLNEPSDQDVVYVELLTGAISVEGADVHIPRHATTCAQRH